LAGDDSIRNDSVGVFSPAPPAWSAGHGRGALYAPASLDPGLFLPENGADHRSAIPRPLRMLQLGHQTDRVRSRPIGHPQGAARPGGADAAHGV